MFPHLQWSHLYLRKERNILDKHTHCLQNYWHSKYIVHYQRPDTHASNHSLDKAPSMLVSRLLLFAVLIIISYYKQQTTPGQWWIVTVDAPGINSILPRSISLSRPSRSPVPLAFLSRHTPLQQVPNLFSTRARNSKNHPHREAWPDSPPLKHWWQKKKKQDSGVYMLVEQDVQFRCLRTETARRSDSYLL